MTFPRTAAYRAAINQLADAVADIPIAELAPVALRTEISSDLDDALERRHRRFAEALDEASLADDERQGAERRQAGARKAALTRAKAKAARSAKLEKASA